MALTHVLLFFHLLGVVSFFAGAAVVGTLQLAAIRRARPSEVYALLRLAPIGAALVGTGALLTLGFGVGLAEHEGLGFSPAWIRGSARAVGGEHGAGRLRRADGAACAAPCGAAGVGGRCAEPGAACARRCARPAAGELRERTAPLAILALMVWR